MIAKKIPATVGGRTFAKLIDYMNTEGKDPHTVQDNMVFDNHAAIEMDAVAFNNVRCKEPVAHYMCSWPEGENITDNEAIEAARRITHDLGFDGHQAVYTIHHDTDNLHVHICINRVHPETEKAHNPYRDYYTLAQTCRELEKENGWQQDKGLYEINDNGEVVQRKYDLDRENEVGVRAAAFESHQGEQSFKTWLKEAPAADLKEALNKQGCCWQDIHKTLAAHNLELREKGSGMIVVDKSDPDKLHAKASDLGRFATTQKLTEKLGAYEKPAMIVQIKQPERDYKRDPDKRIERKEERSIARQEFYDKFKHEKSRSMGEKKAALQQVYSDKKAAYDDLKKSVREDRQTVKDMKIPNAEKQQLYSSIRLAAAQRKEVIDIAAAEKKAGIEQQYGKSMSYRDYAQKEAERGNEVAVSVLRGIAYREGRADFNEKCDSVQRQDRAEERPVFNRTLENVECRVTRHGNISYFDKQTKGELFRDTGKQLIFNNDAADNSDKIAAGLRISREKFGNELHLQGSDKFKEAAMREAAKLGIQISNPELKERFQQIKQDVYKEQQHKQQPDHEQPRQRKGPDMDGPGGMEI